MTNHITVLKNETINELVMNKSGRYLDCTFGGGGHSLAILQKLSEQGSVLGLDSDPNSVNSFTTKDARLTLINANFANLTSLNLRGFDGILADLGWSTDQLDSIPGLSYKQQDALLDMRLDTSKQVQAGDILNLWPTEVLLKLFMQNADIKYLPATKLVKQIKQTRQITAYKTVSDLNATLSALNFSISEITKVYQALRIAVNHELSALQSLINYAATALIPNGRLAIITFHSKEEQVVLDSVKQNANWEFVLPKKYLQPTVQELTTNIRSRSAKLWLLSVNGKLKSK